MNIDTAISQKDLRRTFGLHPSGVTAICGLAEGIPAGIVSSTFVPVSLEPALVSFCVQLSSRTWPRLDSLPRLGISVLGREQAGIARQIAAREGDRFAGVPWFATTSGAVFLESAVAQLECSVTKTVLAGDHAIVLMKVEQVQQQPGVSPLVFHESDFRTVEWIKTGTAARAV